MCSAHDAPCIIDDDLSNVGSVWGSVAVIDHSKKMADAVFQIGGRVDCVRTNTAGSLLVTGDFGAALLALKGSSATLRWHAAYDGASPNDANHGQLCDLAADDSVAALSGCTWKTFDSKGSLTGT